VLLSIIAILLLLVFGVFPYWIATVATGAKTRRQDLQQTETPKDFGADFKPVEFETEDGVTIRGWLLPAREGKATIIFSHGLFRSRRELLERAVDLWRLGYGALLYDSRNHGESGPSRTGLGYLERLDAKAAVNYLREKEANPGPVVLFGISMGASAALLAASETPEVAAVIADSSFLSFRDTTDHHINLFLGLPAFPLANEVRAFIEWRAGFDGDDLSPVDAVGRLGNRPVLFIAAANDKRMPPDIARKLHDASSSPLRDLLIVEGPGSDVHGHAYQTDRRLYIDRVSRFLESALAQ
jgi:pimeloyl-ACP methyl ester carboxylesterase